MLVAKWLCQKSVIFSRSGCGPSSMRASHQPRAWAMFCRAALFKRSAASLKSADSSSPCRSRSMFFSGPSFSAICNSGQVAPKPARRHKCPAFFRSQGLSGLGLYGLQAHWGSNLSAILRDLEVRTQRSQRRHEDHEEIHEINTSLCSLCLLCDLCVLLLQLLDLPLQMEAQVLVGVFATDFHA